MESPRRCSVIIVGAGISGLTTAKVLSENGLDDVVILEAADKIGGRIRKEEFGGVMVELGAGWIAGVGGKQSNPVWELALQSNLRTCFSDYSNARYNIYDHSGKIFPSGIAADSYKKAVDSAIQKLKSEEGNHYHDASILAETPSTPKTPIELAIDFILHDFEMAEVEPISTYVDFGEREFLVADERGYEHLLYKMAENFLFTSEGKITDSRLKLNTVVREVQHWRNGVLVTTEDGSLYEANYVILSASIGVLQSDLISFTPPLPFWPCEPEKEFFIYAHERRGYYTFWQEPVGRIFFTGEHTSEKFSGYVHGGYLSGIDTTNALLEEMRRDDGRKNESQAFLLEPLLALTGSLTSTQAETVSSLHKCDIPRQLFLSNSKLGLPEAIL
ncbi:hypothetical protein RND71_007528 [Anisodus tanguticus]|uniref:Amine oxidase domain-containing protein n=1 Tax=Anisodus tanguticus TaxID=243964 RepID=A0AAE1VT57_9SOLA|nr:hypothetical protein RND71_007528 [Anisodus tanguticus]